MSGTGTIPADWTIQRLEDVSTKIQDGTHFSPVLGGNEYRYITSRNIGMGRLRHDSVEMISEEEHRKIYRRCDVRFGDLLLTKDGANTGNAAINTFADEISLLSSVAFIRSNRRRSIEGYILQYLLSTPARKQIADAMTGNAITRLTLTKIKTLAIPIPPVVEQQRIAAALHDADELAASVERMIVKKQAVKQAMMQQLLTGVTRLPGFAESWMTNTIGQLCAVRSGTPKRWSSGGKYWVIDMGSVTRDAEFVVTKRTEDGSDLLRPGELVMPKDDIGGGNIIGRTGLIDRPDTYALADHVYALTPHGVDPGFLNLAINSYGVNASLRSQATGTAQLGLSRRSVLNQEIIYPSSTDEQRAIADVLADIDDEIDLLKRRLAKARVMKTGMMQELLTGRTRLRPKESVA